MMYLQRRSGLGYRVQDEAIVPPEPTPGIRIIRPYVLAPFSPSDIDEPDFLLWANKAYLAETSPQIKQAMLEQIQAEIDRRLPLFAVAWGMDDPLGRNLLKLQMAFTNHIHALGMADVVEHTLNRAKEAWAEYKGIPYHGPESIIILINKRPSEVAGVDATTPAIEDVDTGEVPGSLEWPPDVGVVDPAAPGVDMPPPAGMVAEALVAPAAKTVALVLVGLAGLYMIKDSFK